MELQRLSIDEVWQKGQEESQSIIGLGVFSPTKYMNRIYGEYVKTQNKLNNYDDYITHHNDFVKACEIARSCSEDQDEADYWTHQINTLDKLKNI